MGAALPYKGLPYKGRRAGEAIPSPLKATWNVTKQKTKSDLWRSPEGLRKCSKGPDQANPTCSGPADREIHRFLQSANTAGLPIVFHEKISESPFFLQCSRHPDSYLLSFLNSNSKQGICLHCHYIRSWCFIKLYFRTQDLSWIASSHLFTLHLSKCVHMTIWQLLPA